MNDSILVNNGLEKSDKENQIHVSNLNTVQLEEDADKSDDLVN